MKPYYQDDYATIYHGDCREIVPNLMQGLGYFLTCTDPPFNVAYDYASCDDNLPLPDYINLLLKSISIPAVVCHYPEETINLLPRILGNCNEAVSWVYSSPIPKESRTISWWGISPDFNLDSEPYAQSTLEDSRAKGKTREGGRRLKDWWNIEYIKAPNLEKTDHPCQMPIRVLRRILKITPTELQVLDPFMGSGTTLVAAKERQQKAIGIEIEEKYCEIAARRLAQEVLPFATPVREVQKTPVLL